MQQAVIDKGFFASVPRLVRTGYQNLSSTAKWIYVCLKDLCGEHGMCYRTLRTLASEIGDISISTLSEAIRALRGAGLITAIKQRRPDRPTAKETWHITIINIWGKNGEMHPARKCSPTEHSNPSNVPYENKHRSLDEQPSQNVLLANIVVRSANATPSFGSLSEPKCSPNGTKEEELKKDHFEERSMEEEREPPTSSPPDDSSFSLSSNSHVSSAEGVPPPGVGVSNSSASGVISPDPTKGCVPGLPIVSNGVGPATTLESSNAQGYTKSRTKPPGSDASPTVTQEQLLDWMKKSGVALGKPGSCRDAVATLLPLVRSEKDVDDLLKIERKNHPKGIIYIANLAKEHVLSQWQQAPQPQENEPPEQMSYEEAMTFAQSLVGTYPEELLGVLETLPGVWIICLIFGPKQDDCIGFSGPKHYNDPTPFERECIQEVIVYGKSLARAVAV